MIFCSFCQISDNILFLNMYNEGYVEVNLIKLDESNLYYMRTTVI